MPDAELGDINEDLKQATVSALATRPLSKVKKDPGRDRITVDITDIVLQKNVRLFADNLYLSWPGKVSLISEKLDDNKTRSYYIEFEGKELLQYLVSHGMKNFNGHDQYRASELK